MAIEIARSTTKKEGSDQLQKQDFLNTLKEKISQEDTDLVAKAYDMSLLAHKDQKRKTGEAYFEHPLAVARILIDELHIRDIDLIISALLHDTGEDSPMYGNMKSSYARVEGELKKQLTWQFNERVADIVLALTKPKSNDFEFKSKQEAESYYHTHLESTLPEAILVKACDRLHNLRTLPDNQFMTYTQIAETRNIYQMLFETLRESSYKEAFAIIESELEKILTEKLEQLEKQSLLN